MVSETANLRRVVQSQSDVNMVVLDFARVNRIDAGGLGVLLELRESLQTRNIAFRFMNVTTLIHQVFELTCLDSVFEIVTRAMILSAAGSGRLAAHVPLAPCAQHV